MILIDDFLTPSYANAIEYEVHQLRYLYAVQTSAKNISYNGPVLDTEMTYDCGQLECSLYHPKVQPVPLPFFDQLKPLVFTMQDKLRGVVSISNTQRAKVNILWQKETFPENHYNVVHQDSDISSVSMIYYVNDSDGDTWLFNEFFEEGVLPNLTLAKRVSPKKNRLLVFDGRRYHASSNPRSSRDRIIINFVFEGTINEQLL